MLGHHTTFFLAAQNLQVDSALTSVIAICLAVSMVATDASRVARPVLNKLTSSKVPPREMAASNTRLISPKSVTELLELTFKLDLSPLTQDLPKNAVNYHDIEVCELDIHEALRVFLAERLTHIDAENSGKDLNDIANSFRLSIVYSRRLASSRSRMLVAKSQFHLKLSKTSQYPLLFNPKAAATAAANRADAIRFIIDHIEREPDRSDGLDREPSGAQDLKIDEPVFLTAFKEDTIGFSVRILLPPSDLRSVEATTKSIVSLRSFCAKIKQIQQNGTFADCTVVCVEDGTELKAHKSFLATKSRIFTSAFESSMKEARENVLELPCDAAIGRGLMDFIYLERMPVIDGANARKFLELSHVYEIRDLLAYVAREMTKLVDVTNVLDYAVMADRYDLDELRDRCLRLLCANVNVLLGGDDWAVFRKEQGEIVDAMLKRMADMQLQQTAVHGDEK